MCYINMVCTPPGDHSRAELDMQIAAAVRENAAIRATNNFREGVTSFLEKRKPRWGSE
jgi:enoyl-CoA hydratase/carnithine racemase